MDGKSVLVTGATRGIGLETAVRLAGLGADVLVHGRDPVRGAEALAAVRAASGPGARPALHLADLSTLDGVRAWRPRSRATVGAWTSSSPTRACSRLNGARPATASSSPSP